MSRIGRRLGTVRVRATIGAVVVVGLTLVAGSVAMLVGLRASFVDRVRSAAELRAADVVSALEAGTGVDELALDEGDDRFIQVVGLDGRVVAASRTVTATGSLAHSTGTAVRLPGDRDDEWLVVAVTPARRTSFGAVVVGREIDSAFETVASAATLLAVGVPLVLAVVGATTWRVVGRALAPVDAIRREADEIGATELHRRVPEPGGADEIARLAETVNRMLERLERGHLKQRRFVSDASHELRSPVASLRQHAEVAIVHPDRTTAAALGETVLAEGDRLARLVDDLVLLARADERSIGGERVDVDLDDIVFAEIARASNGIRIDPSKVSAGRVTGDSRHLERLVRNLVENAARHASTRVAVALGESMGVVVLTVDDDGPGLAAADRERVFERFVRLDEARSRDRGGSGLGLAIVAEVAAAHDATVAVTEGPLGGARFEVRFPARS